MRTLAALAVVLSVGSWTRAEAPAGLPAELHVGLRHSSYGARHHADSSWWAKAARDYAAHFSNATPAVVEIVSTYQDDGSTQFEFAKPADDAGPTQGMEFSAKGMNHDKAFETYDKQGVAAVVQVEPGNADLRRCLEIVHRKFGHHPCVIGLGVDAEWFFTKESARKDGRCITDEEARGFVETTLALNPKYTLFLKHWDASHMPPAYRHPNLYFVSDSQQFASADKCLADFKEWAARFKGSATGYQFGYPRDRKWWSKLQNPPVEMGFRILAAVPSCRYIFWVDFTADKVQFP